MRIIILQDHFPPNNYGGAGTVAYSISRELLNRGHHVFVITTVDQKEKEGEENYNGLKIFKIYSSYHERWRSYLSLFNPGTVFHVKKIMKKLNPDIVHAHNIHFQLSYYCLKLAKKLGAKVFLTAHDAMLFHYGKYTEYSNNEKETGVKENYKVSQFQLLKKYKKRYNPFRNLIIRKYLKYTDNIFAVSSVLKKVLDQNGINNVEIIYNGVDVDEWKIKEDFINNFKNKYKIIDKKVILFGGRLSDAKGGEKIILSMKNIVEKEPKAILLICGKKDRYTDKLIALSRKLGVHKHVIFTDWLSGKELKFAYWSSCLVVVPSIFFESFGMQALEAMACKKPVVATCFGGTSEIVQNNVTGYVVNPYKLELLSKYVLELLGDKEKADLMGEAGFQRAKDRFSLKLQIDKLLNYYR
ncbi:glycosyltransferase family 4 protein [Patescibacteria group bacterium]